MFSLANIKVNGEPVNRRGGHKGAQWSPTLSHLPTFILLIQFSFSLPCLVSATLSTKSFFFKRTGSVPSNWHKWTLANYLLTTPCTGNQRDQKKCLKILKYYIIKKKKNFPCNSSAALKLIKKMFRFSYWGKFC